MKGKQLTGSSLKLIAMISMLIDHIGCVIVHPLYINACFVDGVDLMEALIPDNARKLYILYMVMRSIGRLALPIFAFMIVEGFLHTRSIKKYILRLAVFAALSEIPFDLANFGEVFYLRYQNVMWTFLVAVIMLYMLDRLSLSTDKDYIRALKTISVIGIASILVLFCDGGIGTIFLIASMYMFRDNKKLYLVGCLLSILTITMQFMWIELFAVAALILIEMYNGRRGSVNKYLFYVFYPVHFILLALISHLII